LYVFKNEDMPTKKAYKKTSISMDILTEVSIRAAN